jgi:signal transduction histidine kinase
VASVTVVAVAFAVILNERAGSYGSGAWEFLAWSLAGFSSTGVGLLLATRRRSNPIGWLLLVNGAVIATLGLSESYADYAILARPGALPGASWGVLVSQRAWPLLFVAITAIAWVFPDGRLPSPRWRPYAIAGAVSYAILVVLSFLAAERFEEPFVGQPSPLPELPESVVAIPIALTGLGALACLFGGALAMRSRLKRSAGIERLQFRWLAYAALLIPGAVVICLVENAITGNEGSATIAALVVALTAVPIAIAIAVMRYRLYEIDRLINRTLVYAGLSAALAAAFAAVSLGLGLAIGSGSTLPTAVATLIVALLFGPLRVRMQLLVDRRFNTARYEGLRMVEGFLADLRAGRATPEQVKTVLAEALGDGELELLFALPDGTEVDSNGRVVERATGDGRARTPVRRGDLPLATVLHDEALGQRPDLLESVIGAAGLAIEIARLRVEVRRQLAEVEESRERIVTAGYEERRRLERDLHDGAQQRLVSIGLALRHLQGQLPVEAEQAEILDSTVGEVSRAIAELRELARGVRPAGLDDGLAAALQGLASRSRLRIKVEATGERFEERFETAAYFVASEALANAAKHANASQVAVTARHHNGGLVVSVADDGVGGAVPSPGSGLAGISDRVAALGGSVTVASPAGEGTVVTVELPCG